MNVTDDERIPKIDTTELAQASLDILREEGAVHKPVLLSRLGTRLSARFNTPLRSILGSDRLGEVLQRTLGNNITLDGKGATITVAINEKSPAAKRQLRFDPTIWAAFSKPIPEGTRRFFSPNRPFNFMDRNLVDAPENSVEIESSCIPDPSLSKPEREHAISHQISLWCEANGMASTNFIFEPLTKKLDAPKQFASPEFQDASNSLIMLIEAIPPHERGNFNLPLDLIYRLLKK